MKKRIVSFLLVFVMIFTIAQPAMAYAQVGMNSRGKDVQDLQVMLNTVDNAKLVPDGIFGAKTKSAVMTFQRNNGLSVDGICGPKTWEKLTAKYNAIITPPTQSGSSTATSASSYPMVQNGSSGTAVQDLQKMLNSVQNAGLQTDGIFGTNTKNAVMAFQRANGLAVDGICGPKTWGALLAKYNPNPKPAASSISIGSGSYNPGTLTQGKTYSISGTITSTYSLNSVTVGIYYSDGSATNYVQIAYPRTTTYNIHNVDSYIRFGLLSAGSYYFRVSATDSNGTTKQLVNNSFTVQGQGAPSSDIKSLKDVPGVFQGKYPYCTSCAMTALLRRRQFVDGKKVTFTLADVRVSSDASVRNNPLASCNFVMERRKGYLSPFNDSYSNPNGVRSSYYTTGVLPKGSVDQNRKELIRLLDAHPEGVIIYSKYSNSQHAILITDYEKTQNGGYQFYAIDSADNTKQVGAPTYRTTLEKTYFYRATGGLENALRNGNLIGLTYVQ